MVINKFAALDVETANPDFSSICQVGIVQFEDGIAVESWSSFVNPQDYFDEINVSIHGIEAKHVHGAPNFQKISTEINRRINGQVVAIHTAFDRSAINQAAFKHKVSPPDCIWINTASIARRAWPEVAQKGYGLKALATKLGIEFHHHDAEEDARAAGMILVMASEITGLDLAGLAERIRRPLNENQTSSVAQDGNPIGHLFGEVVVFTGALIIPRRKAAELAAELGCKTDDGVTKKTTMLVVGDQDIRLLNGNEKSNKHRKVEEMIAEGKDIRILTESDFLSMVHL